MLTPADDHFLALAIELARSARANGNHPFGALLVLDGHVVLTAENEVHTAKDPTAHAETNLVAKAVRLLTLDQLRQCTLYTSCEPCAMCVGKIYWAGIRSLAYALPSEDLAAIAGPDFLIPCRELLARTTESVRVSGPGMIEQARAVHLGYWSQPEV